MKTLVLTDEEFELLTNELHSLYGYHWNDDSIHAKDCGSKALSVVEYKVVDNPRGPEFEFEGHTIDMLI